MTETLFDVTRKLRAVLYVRTSSTLGGQQSLEQQVATIKKKLVRYGFPWVIVDIYRVEKRCSRSITESPELHRMLLELRKRNL